jgi:hypothetical protein
MHFVSFVRRAAIVLIIAAAIIRFLYTSPFASTWDEVDFALALDEYDIANMQPHFPGYPFFILGGMAIHHWIGNPTQALAILNAALAVTAIFPMYKLARRYVTVTQSFIVVALLQTSSYFSILVTQSMSEGAALSIVWWYMWVLIIAFEQRGFRFQVLPLVLFALLMGIRLSYAPFGIGIMFLLFCRHNRNTMRVVSLILLAALLQLVWVSALVWNVGGIDGLLKLAFGFVEGHFTEWGGAVTETKEPIVSRLYRLVVTNIVYVGVLSKSLVSGVILALLVAFLVVPKKRHFHREMKWETRLLVAITAVYFLWNLLAQNIDKPRHSYPIVMLFLFLFAVSSVKVRPVSQWLLLVFSIAQLMTGLAFVKEQASQEPATYQLARYLEERKQPLIVYTWEETRVMDYLRVSYEHERFYTYDYYLQDKKYRQNDTIYVTNHLIDGFRKQGARVEGNLKKVAEFRSNPLFDPVYSEIILYEWRSN